MGESNAIETDEDCEVFISYAHFDNETTLVEEPTGWITALHRYLKTRLEMILGRTVVVWRDNRLDGNSYFHNRIQKAAQSAKVVVCVVTPRYVRSESCNIELNIFANRDLRHGDQSRLFVALKTPVETNVLPLLMRNQLHYRFYHQDENEGFREFTPYRNQRMIEFKEKAEDLVQDMAKILEHDPKPNEFPQVSHDQKSAVYLSLTSRELDDERNRILRELQDLGHHILPRTGLAEHKQSLEQQIHQLADQANIAVMMFGESYRSIPQHGKAARNHVSSTHQTRSRRSEGSTSAKG